MTPFFTRQLSSDRAFERLYKTHVQDASGDGPLAPQSDQAQKSSVLVSTVAGASAGPVSALASTVDAAKARCRP